MKQQNPNRPLDPKATTPGVRLLKEIWNISSSNRPVDRVSTTSSSDIYSVPDRQHTIPRRRQGRAVR